MDIDTLRLLHLIARHGGLAPAARVVGMDPSTLSRQVAAAEAQIGARMFERSTRRFKVTEAGARFLDRVAPLIAEFDAARDEAMGARGRVSGLLRLAAPTGFARHCVLPHLGTLRHLHPELVIELLPGDGAVDWAVQRLDLAIRLMPETGSDLTSVQLMSTRDRVVAAPEWVAAQGPLAGPQDLATHDVLRRTAAEGQAPWRFRDAAGAAVQEVAISGGLVIADDPARADAAAQGLGPAICPDWLVAADLAEGRLVDLFPGHEVTTSDWAGGIWAVYPARGYMPRNLRAVLEFLRPRLSDAGRTGPS